VLDNVAVDSCRAPAAALDFSTSALIICTAFLRDEVSWVEVCTAFFVFDLLVRRNEILWILIAGCQEFFSIQR
jgi:hypothetical protein